MDDEYITSEAAAELLGVTRATLYAYVSRKGVRSQKLPGLREHRYWRADIERLLRGVPRFPPVVGGAHRESEITFVDERGPFYRGRSAIELAESASFESVAALLWNIDERGAFTADPPQEAEIFRHLNSALSGEAGVDRAVAHFPFLEYANPRAFDLSPRGMALTGVDIIRWLSAIILNLEEVSAEPIHLQFERALKLPPELTDLLRRLLIISADNGLNQAAYAVRAVASTGVTPWRAVAAGLATSTGRHSKFGQSDRLRRFVAEVLSDGDPADAVIRRLKDGEDLPGFTSSITPGGGDARARALLTFCETALSDDPAYRRLNRALDIARDIRQLEPNFALASTFAGAKLGLASRRGFVGLSSSEAPYLVGRTAGWVAHCIEQYGAGETHFRELLYRGPLPVQSHI